MPQPISSRDDIKTDAFQERLKAALEWIAAHRQTFFSVVGTVAVVIAVAVFVVTNFRSLNQQAWERYNRGAHDDVINNFGRTKAASYSLLAKGDQFYSEKKFAESQDAYRKCLANNPPQIIIPFALSGLGAAQEDSGDYAGAIDSYKKFTSNHPDHILAPKIYESLARVYEISKNLDAAKEIYEKIITMFPDSLWAQNARGRYQALAPMPFQEKPK
ncbi:MAG: hypothetical protein A2901_01725 [Elusimicrobia bacterium RIFCSPLOWO2_01_FULL_54_10]|nr:MAG: hypothetical protein A2901_01725 [Elusimicrobia bacterium RIFCSPLOWO2_01_FULL_54_10]